MPIRRLHHLLCLIAFTVPTVVGGEPVTFRSDVMAVLSKAGCNQGTCHGNANGKGGFKLSLRGDDPAADYLTLTRSETGRRVNSADAARSLLLLKPTMRLAHLGGRRFDANSAPFRIIRDWIAAGVPDDSADAPRLATLAVSPRDEVIVESSDQVQLTATATFTDGATRNITDMAVYEPSTLTVTVTADGRVSPTMSDRLTEVTVAVRFLDQQQPVRLAFLPHRPDFVWSPPDTVTRGGWPGLDQREAPVVRAPGFRKAPTPATLPRVTEIDRIVFAKLQRLRINPSDLCDDTTFVRRAYLDLTGVIPTAEEAREFVESDDPDNRARLIDRLLGSPAFADWWALKWSDLLRNEEKVLDRKGVENFHHWIRTAIAGGMPMHEFARELLSARGSTYAAPAANYYRAMRDPIMRAESAAQVFLGVRLQCAKCHNHPFDRWTQDDYYGWANVFARVDYKVLENRRRDDNDDHEFVGEQIVYMADTGSVEDPRTGDAVPPQLLAGMMSNEGSAVSHVSALADAPFPVKGDPLAALAEWVAHPDNRQFARVQVNRLWAELFGRGIVEPVDDFRATNPPGNAELLEWLTDDFITGGYNLRHTLRTIMTSQTYQLSAEPTETNVDDEANFSHAVVRRLTAEQLLDSLSRATGVPLRFTGFPPGMRAAQLPGVHALNPRYDPPSVADQFLTLFGKPERLQACSCERTNETTLAQTFRLISGDLITGLLAREGNRLDALLATNDRHSHTDSHLIETLYWHTLSRPPTPEERETIEHQLNASPNRRQTLEDMTWALLNSGEFLLRR